MNLLYIFIHSKTIMQGSSIMQDKAFISYLRHAMTITETKYTRPL